MKILFFILIFLFSANITYCLELKNPISVIYDAQGKRIIVANIGDYYAQDGFLTDIYSDSSSENIGIYNIKDPKSIVRANSSYYIADSNIIKELNLSYTNVGQYVLDSKLDLYGMCYDGTKYLYVTEQFANLIIRIDLATKTDTAFRVEGMISKPCGILYDQNNNRLLITEYIKNGTIKSFDTKSFAISTIYTGVDFAFDIKQFRDGSYFVSSRGNDNLYSGNILKFNSKFSESPTPEITGLTTPSGLMINPDTDELYVVETSINKLTKKRINIVPAQTMLYYPGNLSIQDRFYELGWFTAPGADKYRLQISKDSNFTQIIIDTIQISTKYRPLILEEKMQYFWHVRAENFVGEGQYSPTWSYKTNYIPKIEIPILNKPINNAVECPVLSFEWVSKYLYKYHLLVSTDSSFIKDTIININNYGSNIYTPAFNHLSRGITYYWKVKGNYFDYNGDWSVVKHFSIIDMPKDTTMLTYPDDRAINVTLDVEFQWNDIYSKNLNKEFYIKIYRDTLSFVYPTQSGIGRFKLPNKLRPNTEYRWQIKPHINRCDEEFWSPIWKFTTANDVFVAEKDMDDLSINYHDNVLEVYSKVSTNLNFEIYDIYGRIIESQKCGIISEGNNTISINSRTVKGLYFVKLITEKYIQIKKIVI